MLYLDHFGLDEPPFRITPHTDFFFDGADRGATLDALLYAILHDEGIVKVSGEVGSGKTMLCRVLMERLPEHVEIVYLANPSLARDEILHAIADDLGVAFSEDRVTVNLRALEEHLIDLYAEGRRVVILVDEAHAMPEETLEQVRLLSNLESSRHKLLQIVLFGQPELDEVLNQSSMRQLKDRITHSFRMRPLSEEEIGRYLMFRMRAAGYRGPDLFSPRAVSMISKGASGLTRRVNILADKSLLAAYMEGKHAVTARQVRAAIRDSEFGRLLGERRFGLIAFAVSALCIGLAVGAGLHWFLTNSPEQPKFEVSRIPGRPPIPIEKTPLPPSTAAPPTAVNDSAPTAVSGPPAVSPSPTVSDAASKALSDPVASRLDAEALKRFAAYKTGRNPMLRTRIDATRERLEREPDESYSIELFATDNSDPARIERFLARAREIVSVENIYVLPQAARGRYRILVTFGGYPSRNSAVEAIAQLPPKYRQAFLLELRTFQELRREL